jgi:hypothetical protein
MASPRIALLVLGMHRSGTSALTRVLALHGLALPRGLIDGREDNPTGFWEPRAVQEFDDRVLAELGSAWDDPNPLPWPRLSAARLGALREEAAAILAAEYGTAPLIVLKEPRMARLMAVWRPALAAMGLAPRIVLPIRNPLEVATSLAARNGTPLADAARLWLGHVLAAERDTRGLRRAVVQYDALLADWRQAVVPALELLPDSAGVSPDEAAIQDFLRRDLRHHTAYTDEVLRHGALSAVVKAAFAEFRRHPSAVPLDAALLDLLWARFAEGRD